MNSDSLKERLIQFLDDGIILFSKYSELEWAQQMHEFKKTIKELEGKELSSFLFVNERELTGGMGSLIDLVICAENGHIADDFKLANQEVQSYTRQLIETWQTLENQFKS